MPRTRFLAALRGAEGHSLARALAILLLFSLFAAGLHAGAMADTGGNSVLCAATVDGGQPVNPGDGHRDDCCLTGCKTAPPTLAAGAFLADRPKATGADHPLIAFDRPGNPSLFQRHARGPPLPA